jgi:hypothetical protein
MLENWIRMGDFAQSNKISYTPKGIQRTLKQVTLQLDKQSNTISIYITFREFEDVKKIPNKFKTFLWGDTTIRLIANPDNKEMLDEFLDNFIDFCKAEEEIFQDIKGTLDSFMKEKIHDCTQENFSNDTLQEPSQNSEQCTFRS